MNQQHPTTTHSGNSQANAGQVAVSLSVEACTESNASPYSGVATQELQSRLSTIQSDINCKYITGLLVEAERMESAYQPTVNGLVSELKQRGIRAELASHWAYFNGKPAVTFTPVEA